MKRLADSHYQKRADDIDRQYSHIQVNELAFHMMLGEDRSAYLRICTQWAEEKVQARLETYRDAFRKENVMPTETDLSEMSSAFHEIISNLSPSVPTEAKTTLQQIGQRIISDARRDIKIFAQEMKIEQIEAETRKPQDRSGSESLTKQRTESSVRLSERT